MFMKYKHAHANAFLHGYLCYGCKIVLIVILYIIVFIQKDNLFCDFLKCNFKFKLGTKGQVSRKGRYII